MKLGIFILFAILAGCSSTDTSGPPEYVSNHNSATATSSRTIWPLSFSDESGTVTFYEPQIREWERQQHLTAWIAISAVLADASKPVYGALRLEADTSADLRNRNVWLHNKQVTDIRFPELNEHESRRLVTFATEKFNSLSRPLNLDLLLASLADSTTIAQTAGVQVDPPQIYYSAQAAILLQIDGEPLMAPVSDVENIEFTLNTNWDLFKDKTTGLFYLLNEDQWLQTSDLEGDWTRSTELPDEFSQLPTEQWNQTLEHIPPTELEKARPKVYTSLKPAELIRTDGIPTIELIAGTGVSYVTNTTDNLFKASGDWYFLVSGRWFSSGGLDGPWQFASTSLPEGFSNIPVNHPKSSVLSSVPGTVEAQLAVLKSQVPTRAEISRSAKVEVHYSGDPEFEKVDGTKLNYAVNTNHDVVEYRGNYYVCYEGVWFVGTSAQGPFIVAANIPTEIYDIPISHPLYHVTFVTIYEFTPETVTTGYTSGYHHHYVSFGVVLWGSGWYYPPYYYHYGGYPYYYYRPYSYGISAVYNPMTGAYGRRGIAYGPYGGYGRSYGYNPSSGTYARSASVWDHNSGYGVGQAYNPRTNTAVWTEQSFNDYDRWGETVVRRGDEWATISKSGDERGTRRDIATSKGGKGTIINNGDSQAAVGRNAEGDLYAGKNGQVYRKVDEGWERRGNGDWSNLDQSAIDNAHATVERNSAHVRENLNSAGVTKESIGTRANNSDFSRDAISTNRTPRIPSQTSPNNTFQRADRSNSQSYQRLNRDYRSRQQSTKRHNNFSAQQTTRRGRFSSRGRR
jgi:hypothetical protein